MNILKTLSSIILVDKYDLFKFIKTSPHRYKIYSIPKKNNKGVRWIAQPSKNLKYLQRTVLDKFLSDLPVHEVAVAYVKGIGIKENAKRHCKNQYMLKMDFKDFFPSIKPKVLIRHVEAKKNITLNDEDKFILKSIFFLSRTRYKHYELSIGAPSSPFISNTIMYNFDCIVKELCGDEITYTRYADDLIFSTNKKNHLYALPKEIENITESPEYSFLTINSSKTKFVSKRYKRIVTGLVIDNDGNPSLGRSKKRYIKSLVHKFRENLLETPEIYRLQGYISFLKDVEPIFYTRLVKKYGEDVILSIGRDIK